LFQAGRVLDFVYQRLEQRDCQKMGQHIRLGGALVYSWRLFQADQASDWLSPCTSWRSTMSPEDEAVFQSLRHREIMAEDGGAWRLKVPLTQQWLRARG
jgi:hypothetical protein